MTLDRGKLDAILAKTPAVLLASEQEALRDVVGSFFYLTEKMRQQSARLARLRRMMGMTTSERTSKVLGQDEEAEGDSAPSDDAAASSEDSGLAASDEPADSTQTSDAAGAAADSPAPIKPKRRGHGRIPVSAYENATCIPVFHENLRPGQQCPLCGRGSLFKMAEPARLLRIVGQAPLSAVCWDCERLRCSGCGHVFTAPAPAEAQGPKYDETAVAMMALLRYGAGLPLYRLDHLERNLKTPVPDSTQWDVLNGRSEDFRPIFDELCRVAAQGDILHNDDSYARILEFMGKRRASLLAKDELPDPNRTGIFTTAIVSQTGGKPVALFFTGRRHAGENLADVLQKRFPGSAIPILMSDALERNVPKGASVIEANCLAHGRRHVVDEVENFPDECEHLLGRLARVFRVDKLCRRLGLSAEQRLQVHQNWSGPVMDALQAWMIEQFAHKRIEPNSGMGKAMNYLLKRWDKMTRFLHVPGAPLDNNICERALKMAIRHRNNSLFYRSERGAGVGDIFMTLIHTTELHGENPFDYLTVLQRHARAVAADPSGWLPWTYRETLARRASAEAPPALLTGDSHGARLSLSFGQPQQVATVQSMPA